ncbi:MAG: alkaline phosphatase family protein [Bacteriovoracaceae bacterium]|nr:alkaline phosphatase family protein [Bacteriovoracaceae bacterium]
MSAKQKLLQAFDSKQLINPTEGICNNIHLSQALASFNGLNVEVSNQRQSQCLEKMKKSIGKSQHYIFLLIDGLGYSLLKQFPKDGFVSSLDQVQKLNTVFPTSTATALTSLYTGKWPCDHGALEWWLYLPDKKRSIITLPFVDRFSREKLVDLGFVAQDIFVAPSMFSHFNSEVRIYSHGAIAKSTYSRYGAGYQKTYGYEQLGEGIDALIHDLHELEERNSFQYLYYHGLDSFIHKNGVTASGVNEILKQIDQQIYRIKQNLPASSKVIITADHGLLDIDSRNTLILTSDGPLDKLLIVPPTGSVRVPIFHVKVGKREEFQKIFNELYGEHFILLSKEEILSLKLLGPGSFCHATSERIGDFVGIATTDCILQYSKHSFKLAAHHGGLTANEVEVPLLII